MTLGRSRTFRQWHVYRLNLTPPGSHVPSEPRVVVLSCDLANRVSGTAVVSEVVSPQVEPRRSTVRLDPGELGEERSGEIDLTSMFTVTLGTLVEETGRLNSESVARVRAALNLTFEQDAWRDTL